MKTTLKSVLLFAIVSMLSFPAAANDDDHWDTHFGAPGADGTILGMTVNGSDVYITGNFTSAGESACIGIAKWNGSQWSGFGSGFSWGSGPVGMSVAVDGPNVYVGGIFITNVSGTTVKNLAKWDGSNWAAVGTNSLGTISCLLKKGNDLYVGGVFTTLGGITVSNIARWDGTNWYGLGTGLYGSTNGLTGAYPTAMTLNSNGDLIVVGNFQYAGGIPVNNVARWDGNQWQALGNGVYNGGAGQLVNCVVATNNNVYIAGAFKSASGVNATNIARWDGSQWYAMGGGPSGTNYALALVGTNLYTAGNFTNIQGVAAKNVARWNGSSWQPLAAGTAGEILTSVSLLGSDGTNLYAASSFTQAGTNGALAIAKWDGIKWSAVIGPKSQGTWLSSKVVSAANNDVYVGGSGLLIAGGLKPNRIAHWSGSAWDTMGGGVGGSDVTAIYQYGGNVYVGGTFTNAGGVVAKNVAYWDGSSWHALGSGLNGTVSALCIHNGQLFAGGSFTQRGDGAVALPGIAMFDGNDWTGVPTISSWRVNNVVNALASDGVNLYIGGNFYIDWFIPYPPYTTTSVENVGYWDGSNWQRLGTGLTNTVNALVIMNGELYAGGSFTNSGATRVRRFVKWNGSTWSEVGGGITNNTVSTLAVSGSTIYLGGSFTNAGGVVGLNRLAQWNGSTWMGLGTGLNRISPATYSVPDIAASGNDIYMVGTFTHAGGRPSAGFAHWNETVAFVSPTVQLLGSALNGSQQMQFNVSGLTSGSFTVQASTNLVDWTDIYSDSVPNTNFIDSDSANWPRRMYRVKTSWTDF